MIVDTEAPVFLLAPFVDDEFLLSFVFPLESQENGLVSFLDGGAGAFGGAGGRAFVVGGAPQGAEGTEADRPCRRVWLGGESLDGSVGGASECWSGDRGGPVPLVSSSSFEFERLTSSREEDDSRWVVSSGDFGRLCFLGVSSPSCDTGEVITELCPSSSTSEDGTGSGGTSVAMGVEGDLAELLEGRLSVRDRGGLEELGLSLSCAVSRASSKVS